MNLLLEKGVSQFSVTMKVGSVMMLVVTVKDEENAERIYAGKLLCIDNEKITLFYRGRQKTLERKRVSETINVNGIPMMLWNAA